MPLYTTRNGCINTATSFWFQAAVWVLLAVPVQLVAGDPGGRLAVLCIGGFAVSSVASFVFVPAPAGAGIREAIMVALLGTTMSPTTGLSIRSFHGSC
jgi:hypothetical protein